MTFNPFARGACQTVGLESRDASHDGPDNDE